MFAILRIIVNTCILTQIEQTYIIFGIKYKVGAAFRKVLFAVLIVTTTLGEFILVLGIHYFPRLNTHLILLLNRTHTFTFYYRVGTSFRKVCTACLIVKDHSL